MLCERIEDDLMAQKMQVTDLRHTLWRGFSRQQSDKHVDRYTTSGKRLQREEGIDHFFEDAHFINSLLHDEIKKLLQSFGDGCHFEPGPIKTPARALEKVVRRYFHLFLYLNTYMYVSQHLQKYISMFIPISKSKSISISFGKSPRPTDEILFKVL